MTTQKELDAHILIVDDEVDFREVLAEIITRSGYVVHTAADGFEAINLVQELDFEVALVDFLMPKMNGLELMKELKQIDQDIAVIFVTGQGSIESAVNAMKEGAYDYITKPIKFEELENLLKRLLENRRLVSENRQLKKVLRQKYSFQNIIANSAAMMEVVKKIEFASQNQLPVLIHGETGTGKELVAKTIHFNSERDAKTFMPQDSGALSDDLLFDEWIGREVSKDKTSYAKKGIFRLASKGTVFLKEISLLSKNAQEMLFQILQSNKVVPKNSDILYSIDIRIIASSQTDLNDLVKKGIFDQDLYRLLNTIQIDLPPLRVRKEDIPTLIDHFFKEKKLEQVINLSAETISILKNYKWPQNIWELKNVVESLISVQKGKIILPKHLPDYLIENLSNNSYSIQKSLQEIEKEAIQNSLKSFSGNVSKTAEVLQISSSALYRKIKKYKITTTF